jgi:hypothetical protein
MKSIELFWTAATYIGSAAWSPILDNPPYYVDLPLDANGGFVEEVLARWRVNENCSGLAAEL